jgi:hypothetical protein
MNTDDTPAPAAQHYSGRNKVPNIKQFMEHLDMEKRQRDADIDAELKQNKKSGEAKPHKNDSKPSKADTRVVRDPVTGKDVHIRDVKLSFEEAVENPQV